MAIKTPTIVAKVNLKVEKSFLRKQLDKVMDDYKAGGVKGALKGVGQRAGEGLGRGIMQIPKMLSTLLKGFGKIIGIATGIAMIVEVFKPVYSLLEGVFKMIREFVRPVADVITMLLQPILVMIRPIVMMFRTLMMPFRQLAYQGLAAANLLISQGMEMGGEEGKGLIAEGFKGAINAASLMMSGFVRVVFTPLMEALDSVPLLSGIADGFSNAMDRWESSATKGVTRTIVLSSTFSNLIPILGDTREAASRALDAIDEQMNLLEKTIDDWTVDNAPRILKAAGKAVDMAVGVVASALQGEDGLESLLESAEEAAKSFAKALGEDESKLIGRMQAATLKIDDFAKSMKAFENLNAKMMERGQLEKFADEIEGTKGTSWWKKAQDIGKMAMRANPIHYAVEGVITGKWDPFREAKEWESAQEARQKKFDELTLDMSDGMISGLVEMLEAMNIYMTNSLIPESFEKGLQHMHKLNEHMFNPDKGKLITSTQTGYKTVENASNNFVKSMQSVANSIKSIAAEAARYAAQARASASRAASAARAASSARSSY